MLPMRSIPADFIWLLGMNDGAFPRREPRRDFNLIHSGPRKPCDRSTRLDDRYTFLEAIVSARHRLHLSYLGQSLQDNAERPPSAVVRELITVLKRRLPDKRELVDALTIRHPLHPFSHRNFPAAANALGPFTYDAAQRQAAGVLYEGSPGVQGLVFPVGAQLPELRPDDPLYEPDADQLADFFVRPCTTLLQKRLGIYFDSGAEAPPDEEPTDLDGLAGYQLDGTIVAGLQQLVAEGAEPDVIETVRQRMFDRLSRAGSLPRGTPGEAVFAMHWDRALEYLTAKLRGKELPASCKKKPFAELLQAPPAEVVVRHRMSKLKDKDLVRGLVTHLVANANGDATTSLVAGRGGGKSAKTYVLFPAESEAARARCQEHVDRLMALYHFGMRQPLPFVPAASFPYEETRRKGEEKLADARKKADGGWLGGFYPARDGVEVPANRYCLGRSTLLDRGATGEISLPGIADPIPVTFENVAREIYDLWAIWRKPAASGGDDS
jgi:exodeoxyribonuclease V gamma subunit